MSVETKLYLPPETRIDDFRTVLAGLLGSPITLKPLRLESNSVYAEAEHETALEYLPTHTPVMTIIAGIVNESAVCLNWFWESDSMFSGYRAVYTGYRERRRPVFVALADFFGGFLDMNDSDDIEVDYFGDIRNKAYRTNANDGVGWDAFQRATAEVTQVAGPEDWNHR